MGSQLGFTPIKVVALKMPECGSYVTCTELENQGPHHIIFRETPNMIISTGLSTIFWWRVHITSDKIPQKKNKEKDVYLSLLT